MIESSDIPAPAPIEQRCTLSFQPTALFSGTRYPPRHLGSVLHPSVSLPPSLRLSRICLARRLP